MHHSSLSSGVEVGPEQVLHVAPCVAQQASSAHLITRLLAWPRSRQSPVVLLARSRVITLGMRGLLWVLPQVRWRVDEVRLMLGKIRRRVDEHRFLVRLRLVMTHCSVSFEGVEPCRFGPEGIRLQCFW